ncbi:MAG: hypothetical protein V4472_26565 [Pseudomonadota bacterium]
MKVLAAVITTTIAVTMPFSSALAQSSALEQCLQQADDAYNHEMERCMTYPFYDSAARDYCAYGAGLTHDGDRQSCFQGYPEGISSSSRQDQRFRPVEIRRAKTVA